MKKLIILTFSALHFQCSNIVNNRENKPVIEKTDHCIKEGGQEFSFFYDDFSSEGAEGKIIFQNDTIISRILFSYATSMVYTEQEYWFWQNILIKYKQKNNYIKPDKSGYIEEDSVIVEGESIFNDKNFSDTLYQKLLHTASDKNPCWRSRNEGRLPD
jgi:hypothetical protein